MNFFKVLKKIITIDFLSSILLLLFIFGWISSSNDKYDVIFSTIPKNSNVSVIVRVYGEIENEDFIPSDIVRKEVSISDYIDVRKVYEDRYIGYYNYDGNSFYAYVDNNLCETCLLERGVSSVVSAIVPTSVDNLTLNVDDSGKLYYEYVDSGLVVYSTEVFELLNRIHNSCFGFIGKLLSAYSYYIFNGNMQLLMVTTSIGIVMITIIGFFLRLCKFLFLKSINAIMKCKRSVQNDEENN